MNDSNKEHLAVNTDRTKSIEAIQAAKSGNPGEPLRPTTSVSLWLPRRYPAHDRISGSPQMVRVWEEFLLYAKNRPDVTFLRKDEIARYTLNSPLTLREIETI
jgi:hypothetical protein